MFSSYNPSLCTALNWKQPNFPVFLCNDLGKQEDAPVPIGGILADGQRSSSIKDAVRTAQNNNLMGLICCSRLLVSLFFYFYLIFPNRRLVQTLILDIGYGSCPGGSN